MATYVDSSTGDVTSDPVRGSNSQFSSKLVEDPDRLSDQLSSMASDVGTLLRTVDGDRRARSVFYKVTLGAAGATVKLRHGLGRTPFYSVVYFSSSTAAGPDVKSTTGTDETNLVLASYVAGDSWIEVF